MPWEDVKEILRPDPEQIHMGLMKLDKDSCTSCGLCIENCPFKVWEWGEDEFPKMKDNPKCFSCYNCIVACPVDCISIGEPYHVEDGFWKTDQGPLEPRLPMKAKNADGNPDQWNTIEEAVLSRRSVRNYKEDPVPESLIRRVLEAGRFAPSAGNSQPWKFVVITDKALIDEMDEIVKERINMVYTMYMDDEKVKNMAPSVDKSAAGSYDPRIAMGGMAAVANGDLLASLGAPCVILMAGDSRAIGGPVMQIGIAGQNMTLVANSLGIKSCWVGFLAAAANDPEIMKKVGLEPPYSVITTIVLGWPKFKQEGMVPREYRPVAWVREGSDKPEID